MKYIQHVWIWHTTITHDWGTPKQFFALTKDYPRKKEHHTVRTSPEMFPSFQMSFRQPSQYAMLQARSWPQHALRYLIQQINKSLTIQPDWIMAQVEYSTSFQ